MHENLKLFGQLLDELLRFKCQLVVKGLYQI